MASSTSTPLAFGQLVVEEHDVDPVQRLQRLAGGGDVHTLAEAARAQKVKDGRAKAGSSSTTRMRGAALTSGLAVVQEDQRLAP